MKAATIIIIFFGTFLQINSKRIQLKSLHAENIVQNKQNCKNASHIMKQAKCQPRDTIVFIGKQYYPNAVLVKRCSGACVVSNCTASKTKTKYVNVRMQRHCVKVAVEEDVKCACDCSVKPTDCKSSLLTFDRNSCECTCKNQHEKESCNRSNSGQYWDEKQCKCLCRDKICTTGTKLDQKTCRCVGA